MKFLPENLCKKLIKMGCISECQFFWYGGNSPAHLGDSNFANHPEAFCLEDFVGIHEQAKENARIVWGNAINEDNISDPFPSIEVVTDEGGYYFEAKSCDLHRHAMIDSEDWVEYLEKFIK